MRLFSKYHSIRGFGHLLCAGCVAAVTGIATSAHADTIDVSFIRITSNASENVASQFTATIYDNIEANSTYSTSLTSDQILITFTNAVGTDSSISEIYIDDGTIVGQSAVLNSLGGFTQFTGGGASPVNLPGGNTLVPAFVATSIFSADAQGNPSRGVDTSTDILGIAYTLFPGLDLADVQAALYDGSLRIGVHVRSIGAGGQSDAFVNPEPATFAIMSLGGFVMLRRR